MPFTKLQFKPGVNRESTALSNEGGWYACDKVRFRSGYPEKIGGWQRDTGFSTGALEPATGTFWGVARSLWNWLSLAGNNLLGVGTNLKYYIQSSVGGTFNDVTPIRATTAPGAVTFTATNGSSVLQVNDLSHGAGANDFVTFSGAVSLGGNVTAAVLNTEFQILAVVSADTYTVQLPVTASVGDVGSGGGAVVGAYQINTGNDIFSQGTGWGAGGWGGWNAGTATVGWGQGTTIGAVGQQLRLWSQANYGEDLIINPRDGALYYWGVDANPNVFNRATQITGGNAPSVSAFVLVSDSSRFVLSFGCNDIGSATQDPLLVRWSEQEDYTLWTPAITNQAGSFRVSHGSRLISALQTRQEILVWTDAALYSMQYLGPPYVWGFQLLGDNISIAGPNTTAVANNTAYWMGYDKFYTYSGRIETLPCTLRQYVFGNINKAQSYQFLAGTNEAYNEVWWFYCSANATQNDKYVVYNYLEKAWYYGDLGRTAWLDSAIREYPMAVTTNNVLVYHEVGVDDAENDNPQPIAAYIQSSDFDIADGHNFGYANRIIPDVTFDGSTVEAPAVNFTIMPRNNPGARYNISANPEVISANDYRASRTYAVQAFTEMVYIRVRGRQMAFKISSEDLGVQWSLGIPRLDLRMDGRR